MDLFDILALAGGLSLFLFGMSVMSEALERRAEGSLKLLLARLTQNKAAGFLTGLVVTAVIQSSSAARSEEHTSELRHSDRSGMPSSA